LEYIFNRKLFFQQHIDFYMNKAISTVKCMKILRNSVHSLAPQQKCLLYRSCILSTALYGFQLWFHNKASYSLKKLNKMQRRTTIWILCAFCTLPFFGIKAITSLIPICLHLQKLSGRLQLRAHSLPYNHILRFLLESRQSFTNIPYWLSLDTLTPY